MAQNILTAFTGIILGLILGTAVFFYTPIFPAKGYNPVQILAEIDLSKKEVIGFLPYWLISKAKTNYPNFSTLTYFGLTIDTDGKILKLNNPQEKEPGFYALQSGKLDPFLISAQKSRQKLSLLVFNANEDSITALMEDPIPHAQNLIEDVKPIMKQYQFTDLNLDIESFSEASDSARLNFARFAKEVKKGLTENKLGTLTLDIAPDALINKRLINLADIAKIADYIILMAYDYHYLGSQLTGPIAPLFGAGTISEYDTQTALKLALKQIPAQKIILGLPLYGYEWETLRDHPRSATIPSSGLTASTKRIADLLSSCATCSAQIDQEAHESYLIYQDTQTNTFHQIFFPNQQSVTAKLEFAKKAKLAGVAFWALGYESPDILDPLRDY